VTWERRDVRLITAGRLGKSIWGYAGQQGFFAIVLNRPFSKRRRSVMIYMSVA
jgi:hypothetical protein